MSAPLLHFAQAVSWLLALAIAVLALYMLAIVAGSWLYRPRRTTAARHPYFAVLVPAHNEERGIALTIRSLRAVEYPEDRVRIVVIADNCTDRTADAARAAGATVVERFDPEHRGKGQALDWMLREQREMLAATDLLAFVDADMHVDRRFFRAMADAFDETGVLVAQGRYVISNPARSVFAAIGFVSFCYVNHVRPAGRGFWRGTADLKGGGMVFESRFALARGWGAHSIAEDFQLGKELMLDGVRVLYVPDAKVESDIPSTLAQVRVQQSRWEAGKREVRGTLLSRLIHACLKRPKVMLVDGLFDLLVPPLSLIALWLAIAAGIAWWSGSGSLWILAASAAVFGAAVLSGLLQNRAPVAVYGRLLASPAFLVWKLALLARISVARSAPTWQRTPRDLHQDEHR